MLGDKIVDAIEGTLEPGLKRLWSWGKNDSSSMPLPPVVWTEDGSRAGERGLVLMEELAKSDHSWTKSKL